MPAPFTNVEAFAHLDADRHVAASVSFSDHPDATEPTVFIHDRERDQMVGFPLSLFRQMVAAVERKAE